MLPKNKEPLERRDSLFNSSDFPILKDTKNVKKILPYPSNTLDIPSKKEKILIDLPSFNSKTVRFDLRLDNSSQQIVKSNRKRKNPADEFDELDHLKHGAGTPENHDLDKKMKISDPGPPPNESLISEVAKILAKVIQNNTEQEKRLLAGILLGITGDFCLFVITPGGKLTTGQKISKKRDIVFAHIIADIYDSSLALHANNAVRINQQSVIAGWGDGIFRSFVSRAQYSEQFQDKKRRKSMTLPEYKPYFLADRPTPSHLFFNQNQNLKSIEKHLEETLASHLLDIEAYIQYKEKDKRFEQIIAIPLLRYISEKIEAIPLFSRQCIKNLVYDTVDIEFDLSSNLRNYGC